jgi:succinoglycan biosynthesis transport protein ExoP
METMQPQGMDIRRYISLLHKRRYVFIATALIIVTGAVLAGYILPRIYEAKSTVFIERNVIETLVKGIAITPSMEDRLSVLSYTLKSRNLLLKVVGDVGFGVDPNNVAATEKLLERIRRDTDITTDVTKRRGEMNLFIISYRDRNPRRAQEFTNALVSRYIEENTSEKRQEAYGANRFLGEQIKHFKEKLDGAEAKIVNFRKEKGIFVVVDESKLVQEIKTHHEKLDELKVNRMELEAKIKLIKKQLKEENPYTVAILGRRTDAPGSRLLMLQNKLNELMMKYTENYPEVIRTKAEIESLKMQLKSQAAENKDAEAAEPDVSGSETEMSTLNPMYQQLKEEQAKMGIELVALTAREAHLKELIASKEAHLRDIPVEKKKLMDMERERDTYKKIYEDLIQRLGQSEVSKQMEVQDKAATFRVVDPAVLPAKPVSPNRVKLMLMGIFMGLAGGLAMVIGLDSLDKSVKTVDSLRALAVPVLAVIPSIRNEEELRKIRRRDIFIYSIAGVYVLCVLGLAAMEKLGVTLPGLGEMFQRIL